LLLQSYVQPQSFGQKPLILVTKFRIEIAKLMTSDHSETLVQLSHARKILQSQLTLAELDDKLTDSSINTISLIVRTLEKIDQLSRALLKDQKNADEELSEKDFEKLKEKVESLIKQASQRKQD
jgi:hypothetical protein